MKDLCMPKQHGAWAMVIIPFWLGVAASGFTWAHIPFFMGWLLLYLATYPMLMLFKRKKIQYYRKWTLIYFVPAILLLIIPFLYRPDIILFGLIMIPFFAVNAYFSAKKQDRALGNDLSAIAVFSIAGLASAFLPQGEINEMAILICITSFLFFTGCTFYVKTMVREKKNLTYKRVSWGYHILIVLLWAIFREWLIAIALIPSLIRAFYFYGKGLTMKKLGILEIVNAAIFFVVMLIKI